jgi:hypothetical protein
MRLRCDRATKKRAGAVIGVLRTDVNTFFYQNIERSHSMSKSQDAKKSTKKEPAKTDKEKKEAKKVKKEEKKRQQ